MRSLTIMPWKTQRRPRVTVEPWYGNRSGTLFSSRYLSVVTTGVVPCGAMIAKTRSCSTSFLVLACASRDPGQHGEGEQREEDPHVHWIAFRHAVEAHPS